jgi:hypothetical protein
LFAVEIDKIFYLEYYQPEDCPKKQAAPILSAAPQTRRMAGSIEPVSELIPLRVYTPSAESYNFLVFSFA